MPADLNPQQITYLIILLIATGLLITERIRNDIVAVLIVVSLAATRILEPEEALRGFSSEAAIVVAGVFVMSAALHHTGVSETVGGWIGRLAGSNYNRIVGVVMPSVALLSAFTHHVTTTAIMLPVMQKLAREHGIPPSKLLMPLSIAASLGTTITIIGAPAFLIASSLLRQQGGREGLGVFSIAPVGLSITLVGTAFTLLVARFLLPDRGEVENAESKFKLENYFTEFSILANSPYLEKTIGAVESEGPHQLEVVGMVRDGRRTNHPADDEVLKEGDVLLVRTTPEEIVAIRQEPGVELHPAVQYGTGSDNTDGTGPDIAEDLVQAVVAPQSDLVGRSIAQVDFRERYGVVVMGIWRKDGWMPEELAKIRLRAGDVLVLQGDDDAMARVTGDRAFLMMVPFQGEALLRRRAPMAAGIMLATVLLAAFGVLELAVAALLGAVAMVLSGCIKPRQAYEAIDSRIFVFIAGAIPLGAAMEKTGTSQVVAGWLQGAVGGLSQFWILLVVFAVVAVLTQFMSDAATTALFAPVAIALAGGLGHSPEAYVVTAAMAAVAAFLTPIGHHGNLLIYGPGGYRFSDFVKVGAPLTVLVGIVVVIVAQIVWPA